jgi:ribosomal protein S15P/S13E
VTSVTGSKVLRILKGHGLGPEIPEDLYMLIKKAVSMRKHLERNRKDKDGKFRLILIESRIHRLARYYKVRPAAAAALYNRSSSAAASRCRCTCTAAATLPWQEWEQHVMLGSCRWHAAAVQLACMKTSNGRSAVLHAHICCVAAYYRLCLCPAAYCCCCVLFLLLAGLSYEQKARKLAPTFKYESSTASTLVA